MFRIAPALFAGLLCGLAAAPAVAANNCFSAATGPSISFGFHYGRPFTEEEKNAFVQMHLRRIGVNAIQVERWAGCYRAYVKDGSGIHMEFFNAETLEPVD